ncbi:hypothetical protein BJ170DRAFT_595351 [Xylariales sp. AK1849]|nr:hypothetical protein BJ170DRAFT_595351 [Xylariales sp. AK1849]
MADPLSIHAILGVAGQIGAVCQRYIRQVRKAPETVERIMEQVKAFEPQLEMVRDILEHKHQDDEMLQKALSDSGVLEQSKVCLRQLSQLVAALPNDPALSRSRNIKAMLAWPITNENKAKELLHQLDGYKRDIKLAFAVDTSFMTKSATCKKRRPVIDWMTESDLWREFLQGGTFSDIGCRRFLWIRGIPGSGKTILASFLIEKAMEECTRRKGCAFYYCSHEHNQDETRCFLQWIIWDLCRQLERFIPQQLVALYDRRTFTIQDLLTCFQAISAQFRPSQVYIIIDGVDESKEPRDSLLDVLMTIGTDDRYSHVSLLMVSREEADIQAAIDKANRRSQSAIRPSPFPSPQKSPLGPGKRPAPSYGLGQEHKRVTLQNSGNDLNRLGPSTPSNVDSSPTRLERMASPHTPSKVAFTRTYNNSPSWMQPDRVGAQRNSTESRPSSASHTYSQAPNQDAYTFCAVDDIGGDPMTSTDYELRSQSSAIPLVRTPRHTEFSAGTLADHQAACTVLSMSNTFVEKAIRTFIHNRLNKRQVFRNWQPRGFVDHIETTLARGAKGMFRWAACQVDLIVSRQLFDENSITELLRNLPVTVFDTYEGIIMRIAPDGGQHDHNRTFARTALALICSESSDIPDASVLAEASCFNVPHGTLHKFTINRLKKILGCLVRVNSLRRRPVSVWKCDDEPPVALYRIALAHYTVKEFLFAKSTALGPASDFALTRESTRILELQVVFNGLQQYKRVRPAREKYPTRFEEYCLKMTEKALKSRRVLIARERSIWEAVLPCLRCDSPHHSAFSNRKTRESFPKWATLASFETSNQAPGRPETSILINIILLKWPELAKCFLGQLAPEVKRDMWVDEFTMVPDRNCPPNERRPHTVLQLCVSQRHTDLLEILIDAGATFSNELSIVLLAMNDPYGEGVDLEHDGSTTGKLLTMLLERGADPQPQGFKFTPLQLAVRHLEERWVQSILSEFPDPNALGNPSGDHPWLIDGDDKVWHGQHPLEICETIQPIWGFADPEELAEQITKSRAQIKSMLVHYGAIKPMPKGVGPEVVELTDDESSGEGDDDVTMD